jgi:hypothetical protein
VRVGVAGAAAEYRRLASEWGRGTFGAPKPQNALHDQIHALQKVLAVSEEGRAAITALMSDDDPFVRLSAASHSLRWSEGEARRVLEDLQTHEPSMAGFSADYVLREHDAGRLSFDF